MSEEVKKHGNEGDVRMSGQYGLTAEEAVAVKKIIEKHITSYWGDLFKDNEVSIQFTEEGEPYVQIN